MVFSFCCRIERTVREHLMTLRSRFITRWNRHATRKLHSLLPRYTTQLYMYTLTKTSTLLLVHVMVNGHLFFRFEENLSSPPLHEHSAELAEITTSYKVQWKEPSLMNIFYQNFISLLQLQLSGFPLHFRYSDIRHIVSTVESTGIHLCENERVEYALAIYIHPYPNDVLSVWLYIASLIPK